MSARLRTFGRRSAFNVQKMLWLLDEIGEPYEHTELGGSFGGLDDPEFRRLNPHGKVPVVVDGDVVVWESHNILRYLAARHGEAPWWHSAPARRADVEGWMDWSQTDLQQCCLNGLFWHFYRTPAAQRDYDVIERFAAETARCMRLLDAQLEGRSYLVGDALTLADIPAATHLYRYYNMGFEAEDLDRATHPHVDAWYVRLSERPAYREHVMRDFSNMLGRLAY